MKYSWLSHWLKQFFCYLEKEHNVTDVYKRQVLEGHIFYILLYRRFSPNDAITFRNADKLECMLVTKRRNLSPAKTEVDPARKQDEVAIDNVGLCNRRSRS